MGRAMLIVCAATLIVVGMINVTTSKQGLRMTEVNVRYADFIMAKNTAHTAIQIAMQLINADEENWPNQHGSATPWKTEIGGRAVSLYVRQIEHPDFWEADTLYLISNAEYDGISAEVRSLYLKQPFNTLVPDFLGSITLPTGFNSFNIDGSAHGISGVPPQGSGCDSMPGLVVHDQAMADQLPDSSMNVVGSPEVQVDSSLSYEPTDELIARLLNSGNSVTVNGDYGGTLGTPSQPGVFIVENGVKLTGNQSEGFGILVIRSGGIMEYEGALDVAGNFEWNGLMIFENAFELDGRGTPTVNGSVLVGNTADYTGNPINISLGGNMQINYDCRGEDYARMAAALAVEQNLYTHIVTSENANYDGPAF